MWNLLEKRNFHPLPSLFSPSQPGIQNCFHLWLFYLDLGKSQPQAKTTIPSSRVKAEVLY